MPELPDMQATPRKAGVGSYILAVIVGLLCPFMVVYQLLLPFPCVVLQTLLVPVLYGAGGMAPAIVLTAVSSVSMLLVLGSAGLALLPMLLLPSVVLLLGMHGSAPFFDQLRRGVPAAMAGCILSLVLAVLLFGRDFIGQLMDMMRTLYDQNHVLFAEMLGIAVSEMDLLYHEAVDLMEIYYKQNLLANLLAGGAISAFLGVLWGNWLGKRRGRGNEETWVPMDRWYMPASMTIGLLLVLAVSYLLTLTGLSTAVQTWYIVRLLVMMLFDVQMAAALNRSMLKKGWGNRRRCVLTAIFAVVVCLGQDTLFGFSGSALLAVVGAASALFGSHGALREYLEKHRKD